VTGLLGYAFGEQGLPQPYDAGEPRRDPADRSRDGAAELRPLEPQLRSEAGDSYRSRTMRFVSVDSPEITRMK
jgi:hypothetical protein